MTIAAANATPARVFGDSKQSKAKSAGGDSLDNFLAPSHGSPRGGQGMEKRATRRTSLGQATREQRKKQRLSSNLIIGFKARYAGEKKKQERAEKEKQDTMLEYQALGASQAKLSGLGSEANLKTNQRDRMKKLRV